MAVVHQRDALVHVHGGVGEGEFRAAHRIGFHADAEHLAFDAGLHLFEIIGLGEDRVDGFPIADPGPHPVAGNILEAVAGPDIHNAGLSQLLRQVRADPDAGFAVVNPEFPGCFIRGGQGQGIALRMGEEGGVEIAAQAALLAKFHPFLKMLRLQLVPVRPFAVFKDGIAGVQVHLRRAGNQADDLVQVRHQLLRIAGPAGIIAGGLDAPGQGLGRIRVKPADVIPLPAVEGDGNLLQGPDGRIRVDSQGCIPFFCFFVTHFSTPLFIQWDSCIFRLPRAVASIGNAVT